MQALKKYLYLWLLCLFPLIGMADVSQDISTLDAKISAIKQSIVDARNARSVLEHQLLKSELAISRIAFNIHMINRALKAQQSQLNKLMQQEANDQKKLVQEQTLLNKQIRTAYMIGDQNMLKLLLNQQDPNSVSRMNHYFYYFNKQRIDTIHSLATTLHELKITQQAISAQTATLTQLQTQMQQKQDELRGEQTTRHLLLTKLDAQIDSNQLALEKLNANRQRLSSLVNQLQVAQDNSPNATELPTVAFASMQGQLFWPTNGQIIEHFGTPINNSELTTNGTLIQAPDGQTIHAIFPGTVIFSGWLKGFGLLMIIDHGDGYMTLYARNRTLYQQVGAKISAGDPIGQVGESGGYDQSGLYFEIRHNGEPVNPELWCRNRT